MLKLGDRLHLNDQEEIAAQVFEDETVIMRLTDGAYFNMNRVGGTVWEMIQQDGSLEEAIAAVLCRFEVCREKARTDVWQLVERLMQERLVISSNDGHGVAVHEPEETGERLPYETPILHSHNDMGDLLALDPPFGTDCKCGRDDPS